MKNEVYLVTGAAGFLGSNVVQQLVKSGKQVKALVLKDDPAVSHLPAEAVVVSGDITDLASLNEFFIEPEDVEIIVIHCASLVTTSPEKNEKVYQVNVIGTQNIVDLCVQHQVKKLVYVSSTGAILEAPHGEQIVEPTAFYPKEVTGYYAETKALGTQYVLDKVEAEGLNGTVIYPSGIAGPKDHAYGPFVSFVRRYCQGEMPVGVAGTFNAVDVRDLASTTIEAVTKGRAGQGYIISNELVDMRKMFDLISGKSGVAKVERILSPIDMLALTSDSLATNQGASIEALKFELYNLTRNNWFSCKKGQAELGFKPRPFEETIGDTVKWLKGQVRYRQM